MAQHPKPKHPDYDANKERVFVEPIILKPYRRRGYATKLLPSLAAFAREAGASWLLSDTNCDEGIAFAEKIGATEAGREQVNRLKMEAVDWSMMARWVQDGQARNLDTKMHHFINMPNESMIEPFCELVTAVNRLQPTDDMVGMTFTLTPDQLKRDAKPNEANGLVRHLFCTVEENGRLSGLTDFFLNTNHPDRASIYLTGVQKEDQGRGLGKWLKAAAMLNLHENHPHITHIDTENFNSNRPMLYINDQMGFELFEQLVFYKIEVAKLNVE
ncbi:MAG: GNAT family N-acetyltransferase [Chloroflexota bacterium]